MMRIMIRYLRNVDYWVYIRQFLLCRFFVWTTLGIGWVNCVHIGLFVGLLAAFLSGVFCFCMWVFFCVVF
ncbi:hypothetical protein BZA77DRAFT_308136 [Pyronema omphalodes]|nr:hypothetical protein BZA77DRAFT_308136 [Pyronema omphalodes]